MSVRENQNILAENLSALLSGEVDVTISKTEKNILVKKFLIEFHSKIYAQAYSSCDDSYLLSLTNEQLANLIKFITVFEKRFYFRGSVSAVPQLIRRFKERHLDSYEELVNLVIELNQSANPYIPFGGLRSGTCKNLKEYEAMLLADAERQSKSNENAAIMHSIRLEKQKIKDAKNIWAAIRRKDIAAIKVMISRGLNLNATSEEGLNVREALIQQGIILNSTNDSKVHPLQT